MRFRLFIFILSVIFLTFSADAQKKSRIAEIPTVDFCDLINQPSKYDKKIVRTKAIYVSGYHGSSLYDYRCKSGEALMWAGGEESKKFKTNENTRKKYDEIINNSEEHRGYVTIVGRFKDWNGFGHGSYSWYRFEFAIFSFENIESVDITTPWMEKKSEFMAEIGKLRGLSEVLIFKDTQALDDILSNDYVLIDLQNRRFSKSEVLEKFFVTERKKESIIQFGKIFINGDEAIAKGVDVISYLCPNTIYFQLQFDNYYKKQNGDWKLVKTQITSDKSSNKPRCK